MTAEKPREIAIRILERWERGAHFIEDILREVDQIRIAPADRRLIQELTYGVVRWRATLDWLIAGKTDDRRQNPIVRLLLRVGLYQAFWLDRIPDHAVVNETVEMAKRLGFEAKAGFVNAVLRSCLREQALIQQALEDLKSSQPALGHSHPKWLYDRWRGRWGAEKASQLMKWNNTPSQTYARVNTLRGDHRQLLELWRGEGVACELFRRDWLEENLVFELKAPVALANLPSFRQGLFYIQDPSTLLAVAELNPQPGEHILDLCAAPGGKTTFIAQKMQNQGRIIANDTQADRLVLLQQNCARLGVTCVDIEPSTLDLRPSTLCDHIIVDAPCSNTGVMRRRVDLRWRIRPEEIERLRQTQIELLRIAAERLKPGGSLVYSTCSLEPEENGAVVRQFLAKHPEFNLDRERELLPFVDEVDGAYVARICRPVKPQHRD